MMEAQPPVHEQGGIRFAPDTANEPSRIGPGWHERDAGAMLRHPV
jgi:hypothetical protein